MNPLCPCSLEVKSPFHFFLRCHYHIDIRKTFFYELQSDNGNILNQSDNEIVETFMVVQNLISNRTIFYQNLLLDSIKNQKNLTDQCHRGFPIVAEGGGGMMEGTHLCTPILWIPPCNGLPPIY